MRRLSGRPGKNPTVLVGRDRETARIALLIAASRDRGGALAITGEPGVGKTALLEHAAESAAAQGCSILQTRGFEAEFDLPFAALMTLLRPIAAQIDALPPIQRDALGAALNIRPPASSDPLTIAAGTLTLLSVAAETAPLVVIVDDLHWIDSESRGALLFCARRLHEDRVAMLLAARPDEGAAPALEGIEQIALRGIDSAAASELIGRLARRAPSAAVAERLVSATAGNPLALAELAAVLSQDQLAGLAPLDEPLAVGPRIQAAFTRRVERLKPETRAALLVAAVAGSEDPTAFAEVAPEFGADLAALAEAERAGLVRVEPGAIHFRHPLVLAAVYHGGDAPTKRAIHRALASSSALRQSTARRAWHLAAAAVGPDPEAAAALVAAADEARARSGYGAAAAAMAAAARLTAPGAERDARLLTGAEYEIFAGLTSRAAEVLEEVIDASPDTRTRAEAQYLLGRVQLLGGSLVAAHDLFVGAADALIATDPERAALMLLEGSLPLFMAGRIAAAVETTARAFDLRKRVGPVAATAAAVQRAATLMLAGRATDAELAELLAQRKSLDAEAIIGILPLSIALTQALTWIGAYDEVCALAEQLEQHARGAGALGAVPLVLAGRADAEYRSGLWAAARAHASESIRLAEDTGQRTQTAFPLVTLAKTEAGIGAAAECRAHVAAGNAVASAGSVDSIPCYADAVLGLLELGLGNAAAASVHLLDAARRTEELGMHDPTVIPFRADLIEALARQNRVAEAEAELEVLVAQAARTARAWPTAAVARCQAILGTEQEVDEMFQRAVALLDNLEPFERARTELAWGQRLRLARRRADARDPLRRALNTFESLGAEPWARQARAALRAAGAAVTAPRPAPGGTLTAQELEIALRVARGATNRDVAAALFVSPKTVEAHLTRIYKKLGVRSRAELAGRFAAGDE